MMDENGLMMDRKGWITDRNGQMMDRNEWMMDRNGRKDVTGATYGEEWNARGASGGEWRGFGCVSGEVRWRDLEGAAVGGVNARRDKDEAGVWRPAGCPVQLRDDLWRPVASFALDGASSAVLMVAGSLLGVTVVAGVLSGVTATDRDALPTGVVTELGQIGGGVIGVDRIEDGMVRVFLCHSPSVYITYVQGSASADAAGPWRFTLHGAMPQLPGLRIEVDREQTFSEPVNGLRLSGAVNAGASRLTVADATTLSAHVVDAYKRLAASASKSGYGLQPVLARYRIEDIRGATLAVGPTVMVSSSGGFQCAGGVDFTLDTEAMALNGTAIVAKGYTLKLSGLKALAAPWNRLAGRVVVETSAPIEPFDPLGSTGRGAISSDGRTVTVTMPLPGTEESSVGQALAMQTKVGLTLEADLWMPQAVSHMPFSGGVQTVPVPLKSGVAVKGERVLPTADSETYRTMYDTSAGMVVASDPCVAPFDGYTPAQIMTRATDEPDGWWRAVATVTLREPDGTERLAVSASSGAGELPQGFSPLLCYPDTRAVSVKIALQTAGGISEQRYPLRPAPTTGCAYYIGTLFQPMLPAGTASTLEAPPSTVAGNSSTGVLLYATYATLAGSKCRSQLATGPITAVSEWPAAGGSWDFSRTKIALGTGTGVYQATFTADNRLHSVRRMSSMPVAGPFVECSDGDGRFLVVQSANGVMHLCGSRVSVLDSRLGRAVSIAFGGAEGEFWWIEDDASGTRRLMRGWYLRKRLECSEVSFPAMADPQTLQCWQGCLLIGCSGGLFDASREQWPDGAAAFGVILRHDLSSAIFRPVELLKFNMFGSGIRGEISLYGDRGSRVAEPLARFCVEGDLNEGIVAPVFSGGRSFLETHVDILAGRDAELRPTQCIAKKM